VARRRKFEGAWIDRSETEAVETILPAVVRDGANASALRTLANDTIAKKDMVNFILWI
jgi:hypothetical protein